jgi:hypothetical protein
MKRYLLCVVCIFAAEYDMVFRFNSITSYLKTVKCAEFMKVRKTGITE